MENEKWRPIDWVGVGYEVSNKGRVRSRKSGTNVILAQRLTTSGYPRVNLYTPDGVKAIAVHRLVAFAWVENVFDQEQVNHKNFNKKDNRSENLEWVSAAGNARHAAIGRRACKGKDPIKRTGTKPWLAPETNPNRKLTWAIVEDIRRKYDSREYTQTEIAREYGVACSTISKIVRRQRWN